MVNPFPRHPSFYRAPCATTRGSHRIAVLRGPCIPTWCRSRSVLGATEDKTEQLSVHMTTVQVLPRQRPGRE
ncbi:hypothetical protein DTO207G8_6796 [Paecilomyces variotii]|nr:hypothetical protein DTO207G8_6796 [Paecilomyces variotii]